MYKGTPVGGTQKVCTVFPKKWSKVLLDRALSDEDLYEELQVYLIAPDVVHQYIKERSKKYETNVEALLFLRTLSHSVNNYRRKDHYKIARQFATVKFVLSELDIPLSLATPLDVSRDIT